MNSSLQQYTIKQLRTFGRDYLSASTLASNQNIETLSLEVDMLLGHVLKMERIALHINADTEISSEKKELFEQCLQRRLEGEPIAYILQRRDFWGLPFFVSPSVLIPRPETELVVSRALNFLYQGHLTLVDVGVGSGAIILSILDELRAREGEAFLADICAVGVDVSAEALEVCARNAKQLGLDSYLELRQGSLLDSLDAYRKYSKLVVVSNPPYVPTKEVLPKDVCEYEPASALFAGDDGLDIYRSLAQQLGGLFAQDAVFIAEHGLGQEKQIAKMLEENGAGSIEHYSDLAGIVRVIEARG